MNQHILRIAVDCETFESLRHVARTTNSTPEDVASRMLRRSAVDRKPGRRKSLPAAEIVSEYERGASSYSLGEKHGVNHLTILKLLRNERVHIRQSRERVKHAREVAEMLKETTLTYAQIGERLGISPVTIAKRAVSMMRAGIKLHPDRKVWRKHRT